MSQQIAVVDDEPDIVELVTIHLKRAGYEVKGFPDAGSFLKYVDRHLPHLVLLDLMLPDMDGLEICRYLRREDRCASVAVIVLTARGEETDRVLGLELGADDYVVKPFSPRELMARVKAVLRRRATHEASVRINIEGVSIDPDKYEVKVRGKTVSLTPTEFKILNLLASRRGRVFTRDQILDHLWGTEKAVIDRTVDVHIKNLREKLGPASRLIRNVRGVGYRIA